jgi:hypothetical protein
MTRSGPFVTATILAVPCLLAAAVPAQELAVSRVLVERAFTVHTEARGVPTVSHTLPARADVTAGLSVTTALLGANANVNATCQRIDQALDCQLWADSVLNGLVTSGLGAGTGQPRILLELTVPRPMPVRFLLRAAAVTGTGMPPPRSVVDIGADGVPELDFFLRDSVCGGAANSFILDLPAGRTAIRLAVDLELPSAAVGNQVVCASALAGMRIEPAHATGSWEGSSCGTFFDATPMLDGTNVRFWVGLPYTGSLGVLVLGTAPAAATLPQAPWCSLLVSPDVVLPMAPTSATLLPLGALALDEVFAQGLVWAPGTPWQPGPHLYASSRLRMQLR